MKSSYHHLSTDSRLLSSHYGLHVNIAGGKGVQKWTGRCFRRSLQDVILLHVLALPCLCMVCILPRLPLKPTFVARWLAEISN
eukprot:507627-Amphidinium_carterae.1